MFDPLGGSRKPDHQRRARYARSTVASFLQRLGRTGRRAGTSRNCLFLCLDTDAVAQACGLLLRWSQGWVEPVEPPVAPRHILAQQILALALQEGTVGTRTWREWWGDLPVFDESGPAVLRHLVSAGYLVLDGDLAIIGPEAEWKFGRRYFSDLTAVFSAAPQFTVLAGNAEIGTVGDDLLLSEDVTGPRVLLLAGRSWLVTSVDWKRRRCQVEPTDLAGRAKWSSQGAGLSFAITRGVRDVLRGTDPANVTLTRRASVALAGLRDDHAGHTADATVVQRSAGETLWWTWAGTAANRSLHASLPDVVDDRQRIGDRTLRLRPDVSTAELKRTLSTGVTLELPQVDDNALTGLKFSTALPPELARRTVAERLVDPHGAAQVLRERRRFIRED